MLGHIILLIIVAVLYLKMLDALEITSREELVKKLKQMRQKAAIAYAHQHPQENKATALSERIPTDVVSLFGQKLQWLEHRTRDTEKSGFKNTMELIVAAGYPYQAHTVTTSDGYQLELHRIPPNKMSGHKGTVCFQHGFEDSSETWVLNNRFFFFTFFFF